MTDSTYGPPSATDTLNLAKWLELLAVFIVAVSALGIVTMRMGAFHAIPIWLLGGLASYTYAKFVPAYPGNPNDRVPIWHMVTLLCVGLIFRLPPFEWILGGQDQGVYVNMAAELARTGALMPTDAIAGNLDEPSLRDLYWRENHIPPIYFPGIYTTETGLVFQFYHLFPLWMAMFGMALSSTLGPYALTFLSLVSLVFFYRVAQLITNSGKAGLAAGLLLAVNPLHAFFSKFPVTEVPTLAFSLMSCAFLLSSWKASDTAPQRQRWLFLSAACMGLLFMTRISGFMYMPWLFAISLAVFLSTENAKWRWSLLSWCALVVAAYAVSVLYGLKWSRPYSSDIYRLSFEPLLGHEWPLHLLLLSLAAVAGWLGLSAFGRRPPISRHIDRLLNLGVSALPVVAMLLVVAGLWKAYRLGFTDAYATSASEGGRWQLSHQGWRSVLSTSLPAAAIYLSPFVFLTLPLCMYVSRRRPELNALSLFVIFFLAYLALLQWVIPYQPYYARYLLSEFVPYTILLAVCAWACLPRGARWKRLIGACLLLGGVSAVILSAKQIGKQELGGIRESVDHLTRNFDKGDLVIIRTPFSGNLALTLGTTLTFVEDINVMRASDQSLRNQAYMRTLAGKYDEIYILSDRANGVPEGAELIDAVRFANDSYPHGHLPPIDVVRNPGVKIDVYRYTSGVAPTEMAGLSLPVQLISGWGATESWGVWTVSNNATFRLDLKALNKKKKPPAAISISGRVYLPNATRSQRLTFLADGLVLSETEVRIPQRKYTLTVPWQKLEGKDSVLIEVRTPDAISPSQAGESADTRLLGFGLESIALRE